MNIDELKSYKIFEEELLSLETLKNQGFNNISYLLKTTSSSYVIRVFKSNESVNISREFEYQIQKKAYKNNLASKPIFLNEKFMIYKFIEGIHKTKLSKTELKNLTLKIKKFHNFKTKEKPYDIKKDLQNYNKNLNDSDLTGVDLSQFTALQTLDLSSNNITFFNSVEFPTTALLPTIAFPLIKAQCLTSAFSPIIAGPFIYADGYKHIFKAPFGLLESNLTATALADIIIDEVKEWRDKLNET